MVKKMNKTELINILQEKTNITKDNCIIINNILESHFLLGNITKQKIVDDLMQRLKITENKAEEVYKISMEIISLSVMNKLKHPFKSED